MSRIARNTTLTQAPLAATDEVAMEEESLNFAETPTASEHIARVVFEANATADQLARGHTVRLSGAKQIFHTGDVKTDYSKGIVTSINTCSVYSDCSEPITLSLNLFNTSEQQPNVQNEQGWLHAPQHTDFGAVASGGGNGFKNLLNILPFEKTRCSVVTYKPEDVVNDRYIQQYGSYNQDNLWDGVVAFPGEQYYLVSQGHVVLSVIKNNWEQLGINVDDEHRFNGKYVQVPAHVFDRVIKDLEAQVLSRMPFTNLNDIRAQFSTKQATSYNMPHEEGTSGKYKVVVEMAFNYQFPSNGKEIEEQ
jgi:hypothetical protein